jgi:hypothetical protein
MQNSLPTTPYDKILTVVRTVRERDTTREQCEGFLKLLYTNQKGTLQTLLTYSFSDEMCAILLSMLKDAGISEDYKMKIQNFIIALSEYLETLPILTLTLSFSPTKDTLLTFCDWARQNLDTRTLIAYHTDETLFAGAIVEFNGVYKEFSLREIIPQYIQTNRDVLLHMLL